jgi:hypothetical protein
MKFGREAQMEQRALWDKSVADYTAKLKAAGIQFITVDKKPFFDATAPVRAKYGASCRPDQAHRGCQVKPGSRRATPSWAMPPVLHPMYWQRCDFA